MSEDYDEDEDYDFIDWVALGWPRPNPYGEGDIDEMPIGLQLKWLDECSELEVAWEVGE